MTRTAQLKGLERAQAVLQTTFGYGEFRGAQRAIIEQVLGAADALVLMPTGGGNRSATRFRPCSVPVSASSCRP